MQHIKQSVYLQIVENIKREIGLGLLTEGEKLPSCRDLAMKMGINPNTVQRAYSTLEEGGYIYTVPKKGVYVSAQDKKAEAEKLVKEKLSEFKLAGVTREQLIRSINEIYGEEND